MVKTNLPREFNWREEDGSMTVYGPGEVSIPTLMYHNLLAVYPNLPRLDDDGNTEEGAGSGEVKIEADATTGTPLPPSFPKRDLLMEVGLTTIEAVLEYDDLTEIKGIGPAAKLDILTMGNYYGNSPD